MKRTVRLAVASVLAIGLALPAATAANAGDGLCASGYACGYDSVDYNGDYYGTAKDSFDWALVGFSDRADSASVNGRVCKYTDFYDTWHSWDSAPIGKLFTLYSRQIMKSNYRDRDLSKGAGYNSSGTDIRNRVGATVFWGC